MSTSLSVAWEGYEVGNSCNLYSVVWECSNLKDKGKVSYLVESIMPNYGNSIQSIDCVELIELMVGLSALM